MKTQQGGGRSQGGFTIVETMIVLAITGILAAGALVMVSGRQNNVEFQTAINGLQQQFQQIINETASGFYPSGSDFTCTPHPGTKPTLSPTPSAGQGTNAGCIFLGKLVLFGADSTSNPGEEEFVNYPLAGNRLDSSGDQASTLYGPKGTLPVAVAPGIGTNTGLTPDLIVHNRQMNGLKVYATVYYLPDGSTGITQGFAILNSLAQYGGSNCTGPCSGSQQLGLYALNPAGSLPTTGASIDYINNNNDAIIPVSKFGICFASGTTNQSGLITIGNTGGLSVALTIKENKTCA